MVSLPGLLGESSAFQPRNGLFSRVFHFSTLYPPERGRVQEQWRAEICGVVTGREMAVLFLNLSQRLLDITQYDV